MRYMYIFWWRVITKVVCEYTCRLVMGWKEKSMCIYIQYVVCVVCLEEKRRYIFWWRVITKGVCEYRLVMGWKEKSMCIYICGVRCLFGGEIKGKVRYVFKGTLQQLCSAIPWLSIFFVHVYTLYLKFSATDISAFSG